MKIAIKEGELRPEYDMKRMRIVERGPARAGAGKSVILDPDVALMFPSSEAVNEALRRVIRSTKPGQTAMGG